MSRLVPKPTAPTFLAQLGDPISQAEKFIVEIFEDSATWEAIDESKVPTKSMFGPRAIIFGGWFPTCARRSHVCVNDLSERKRGALCVFDCTSLEPKTGRFSAEEVDKWIKVGPYRTTDKLYHPNITTNIQDAPNLEVKYVAQAEDQSRATYTYQLNQGSTMVKNDLSTEENVIDQPEYTLEAISWLPNVDFDNFGNSLDGFPMFLDGEPYEIIWSWKDNTQDKSLKADTFYEVARFNVQSDSALSQFSTVLVTAAAAIALQVAF